MQASIEVMVTIDPHEVIRLPIEEIHGLPLRAVTKKVLLAEFKPAERFFDRDKRKAASRLLKIFGRRAPRAQKEKAYRGRRKARDRPDPRPRALPAGILLKTTSD